MKIVIAASGNLGFQTIQKIHNCINLVGILTDSKSGEIISYCNYHDIPVVIGNPRNVKTILEFKVRFCSFDLLFSINFLYLFNESILSLPKLFSLNIHGSLLPKYRGRAPHIWAIINGESEVGITIHKIEVGCDTGDILVQKQIEISNDSTGGEVLDLYSKYYPELILESINSVSNSDFSFTKQDDTISSYYPKRTPEDGEIKWNLTGREIYNWVRALTRPYPGAFAYLDNKKILIWKVKLSNKVLSECKVGSSFNEKENLYFKCKDCFIQIIDYDIVGGSGE